jgi:F-type H+-transporting ATPase subunit epsilon
LSFELVTPERIALSQEADSVVLPAFEGEMGVLPGHEPFMVQLKEGEIRVTRGGEVKSFAVSGGFAEVLGHKVEVFAETAEMAGEIDEERARQGLEKAKAALARPADSLSLAQAEAMMKREQVRLRVADMRRRRSSGPSR